MDMLIPAWHSHTPPARIVAQVTRPMQQSPLELSLAPSGFTPVEDLDGSMKYSGSNFLCKRLAFANVQVLGVRHGQAESNAQSEALGQPLLYGQSESPLTDKGRQQARDCAGKLYEQLGGSHWLSQALEDPSKLPVLVSSDVSRAQDTAAILKSGLADEAEKLQGPEGRRIVEEQLTILSDARLRETNFGRFETRPLAELQNAYPDFVSHWRPSQGMGTDFRHRFPGGESRADVMKRVGNFLDGCCLRFPGKTVIMVSHGETLLSTRALLGKAPVQEGKVAAETGAIPNAAPFWLVQDRLPAYQSCPHELD